MMIQLNKYLILAGFIALVSCKDGAESPEEHQGRKDSSVVESSLSVAFLDSVPVVISRDYNQSTVVSVKNSGDEMAKIRVQAEGADGLLAGFAGRGSAAWNNDEIAIEVPPGETWELPVLLHADRAEPGSFEVTLKAMDFELDNQIICESLLKVEVLAPEVKLNVNLQALTDLQSGARLAKTLRVRNEGAVVSDLSVDFEVNGKESNHLIVWGTVIDEYRLSTGGMVAIRIAPRLSPSFEELTGELVIRGGGKEQRIPYQVQLPENKRVYVTLSRTTRRSDATGTRCTNRPSVNYEMPPSEGTPAVDGGGGNRRGGSGRRRPTTPVGGDSSDGSPDGDDPEEEEDDGFGWLGGDLEPTSPDSNDEGGSSDGNDNPDAAETESGETDEEIEGEPADEVTSESTADDAIFDLLDSNMDKVMEGLITPESNGTTPAEDFARESLLDAHADVIKDYLDVGGERSEKELRLATKPAELTMAARPSQSLALKDGKKAHLVHRKGKKSEGDRLDFSFGIQPGVRKKVPMSLGHRAAAPVLGPSPGNPDSATATYIKKGEGEGTQVEMIDAKSGKRLTIGDSEKFIDSAIPVASGDSVDVFYREDGELKRAKVGKGLELESQGDEWPPADMKTGPLLKVKKQPDGKDLVASLENDSIALRTADGIEKIRGNALDIAFNGDQRMMTVRRDDGAIDAIEPDGVRRLVEPSMANSAPALLNTADGGLRMFFNRDIPKELPSADASGLDLGGNFSMEYKEGKWSEPRREFMPEAPVEKAAVVTSFDVPYGKSHYKKMDVGVSVNGHEVGKIEDKLPNGRFIHRINPEHLNYRNEGGGEANMIKIDTKGMSPGHYHYTDKASLYTSHRFCQDCLVAGSAEEAERIARQSDKVVRHSSPDLIVASNGFELPEDIKPGQDIEVDVALFNTGDESVPAGKVRTMIDGEKAGEADFPDIRSFRGHTAKVKVTVPMDWDPEKTLKMEMSASVDGDADPSTNKMNFFLLKDESPELTRARGVRSIDVNGIPDDQITEAKVSGEGSFETALSRGVRYIKIPMKKGKLEVEVIGRSARSVRHLQMFQENGKLMDESAVKGNYLYLRIDQGQSSETGTKLKIWWQE